MKVPINVAKQKVDSFLRNTGLNDKDVTTLSELVIDQQIIGNQFSAVGELAGKHQRLIKSTANSKEEIVLQKPSAMLIKGNGRMAPLITADYLPQLIDKAKKQGIFACGIYDASYNDFFDVFCRRIAKSDCVSIFFENGGPQGVLPFGALKQDVTGTNPLAYGVPSNDGPIVFDAATAEHAYGRIRQAKELGEKLPDNAYVDESGNITTDPHNAYAILPFGGYKGWAINILVDVLSGAMVRARSGLDIPLDEPDRFIGTFMIIIDPACFGDINEFKASMGKLITDITSVEPKDTSKPVHVPGAGGSMRIKQAEISGELEIEEHDWLKFLDAVIKGDK